MKKNCNLLLLLMIITTSMDLIAQTVTKSRTEFTNVNYKNSENPFDEVGQKHNEGLRNIMTKLKSKKLVSQEDVINATSEYLNDDISRKVSEILKQKNVWSNKNSFFLQNEINQTFENSPNLSSFISKIKNIEKKIISNKTFAKEEEKYNKTLMALAVARYSAFYWISNDKGDFQQGKINWGKIRDDLEGAGTGAGIGGAIGGVGGAVIGGICGAIIGSACAVYDPIVDQRN